MIPPSGNPTDESEPPCEFLSWDTEFFGIRIARVHGNTLTTDNVRRIDQWCKEHRIECLYFLADVHDIATSVIADGGGYRYVDTRVTFERHMRLEEHRKAQSVIAREFRGDDLDMLQMIAHGSYTDSRFYFDGRFSREKCDGMYVVWISRSCDGFADSVFVAEVNGLVTGFITCNFPSGQPAGRIGLVGVSHELKGTGVGSALIEAALAFFVRNKVNHCLVTTQARNLKAMRFYQKNGFLVQQVQTWFHKWF
jgi:dTDP-4-amino-4,6-dideoxy-D-galactose acyltransferase